MPRGASVAILGLAVVSSALGQEGPLVEANTAGRMAIRGRPLPDDARPVRRDDLPPELTGQLAMPQRQDSEPDWVRSLTLSDLPVKWDPRVLKFLEFYRDDPRGHAIMEGWLRAQGRFRSMILAALRRHGLPADLLYVCMIESSYDPWEYSRAGASGLWQFMPHGGRIYGLKIDHWIDERNNPEKSTEAAMLYFRDLYDRFGEWHLALAAYNAGYGAVLRAMAKYNTNDFWSLLGFEDALPWGSSIYVPKALAAAIVGRNRAAFGFTDVREDAAWDFDWVTVPKSISFATIAKAAGVSATEIASLNPELRRGRTPPVASYQMRIPKGTASTFARTFPQLRGDWDRYEPYLVRWGERFEDIARTHGLSVKELKALNAVDDIAAIRGGVTIVVPHVDDDQKARNRREAEDDLYQSSGLPSSPGDPLIVPVVNKDLAVPRARRVFYRVVAGDTASEVAAALRVTVADLATWNRLEEGAALQPRMVLTAFVPPGFDPEAAHVALLDEARLMIVTAGSEEHLALVEGRKGRTRSTHVVKRRETLESIGKRHHLSKYDMARINRMSPNAELVPGQELIVYAIADRRKAKQAGVFKKPKPVPKRTVPRPRAKVKPKARRR